MPETNKEISTTETREAQRRFTEDYSIVFFLGASVPLW